MTSSHDIDTVTVAQAAEALGVSERTVWRYLKSGRLAGRTVGQPGAQRTLIPAAAVVGLREARAGADADELRAERDRLAAELAAARAEAAALSSRVSALQRALTRPGPGMAERAVGRVLSALARTREPRARAVSAR